MGSVSLEGVELSEASGEKSADGVMCSPLTGSQDLSFCDLMGLAKGRFLVADCARRRSLV